jgi:hypothetical protein
MNCFGVLLLNHIFIVFVFQAKFYKNYTTNNIFPHIKLSEIGTTHDKTTNIKSKIGIRFYLKKIQNRQTIVKRDRCFLSTPIILNKTSESLKNKNSPVKCENMNFSSQIFHDSIR